MSTSNNSSLKPDYRSAQQWSYNYFHNNSNENNNNINIFWITIVTLLLLLAIWWWWTNYRSFRSKKEKTKTPIDDLKQGSQKTNSRLFVKPDGTVVSD